MSRAGISSLDALAIARVRRVGFREKHYFNKGPWEVCVWGEYVYGEGIGLIKWWLSGPLGGVGEIWRIPQMAWP